MKNIDFLPDIYRQKRVLRHARIGWMGVGLLFGLVIGGAATGQWYFRCALASRLKAIEPQYAISMTRQAATSQLEEGQALTEELAALYLYLDHPWPKTQLLAALAQPLPSTMQLTDLQMLEQADAMPVARNEEGDQVAKMTPKSVLTKLRQEYDRQITIIELSGEAVSVTDLHGYVDTLAKSPLFSSASLKGLVSGNEAANKGVSRFQIRVVVRPGYGQPQGVPLKANTAAVAVVGATETRGPGGSQ